MKIDTHQHFWKYNERDYGWMGPKMATLKRDRLPGDLAPLLKDAGIDGTIAVQARQNLEETEWLLKLADENPFIKGVVGWVDLRSPTVEEQLERFSAHPKLRGIRHVVHDESDDRFVMRDDFIRGIGLLAKYGLTYDLLLFPKHLPVACELVRLFPGQPFVLDHISKPFIKDGILSPWDRDIARLASFGNVSCKVSGMVTEADWGRWKPSDFTPYLDVVFECFGARRVTIGSDWPVCTVAGSYADVMRIPAEYVNKLSDDEQAALWGGNARRIYRIGS